MPEKSGINLPMDVWMETKPSRRALILLLRASKYSLIVVKRKYPKIIRAI
jgi:hypothetical protein